MHARTDMRLAWALALLPLIGACAPPPASRVVTLCADLAGAGPSSDATDPDHRGMAILTLTPTAIHYEIHAPGLGKVTATHVHHAEPGFNGPMLWELNSGFEGESAVGDTTEIPHGVIALMETYPREFYVKLHSVAYPGGAIRGQLVPCGR